MSDNIKVVIKVRPLISREIEDKLFYQWRVKNNTLYQIDQHGKDYGQVFTFDKVYDNDAKTTEVFNDIAKPIVEAAIAGINGTIFAYGQTSSGKTYTMTGTDDSPGIIPLAVLNLFDAIKNIPDRDFLVRVSFVEIYNETLTDLLDVKKNVRIHETFTGIKVDTTEKATSSPEEVFDFMKLGNANRQTASTNMNDESSRSHSIFQITIESRVHIEGEEEVGSVNISQLNLVDLAGSERAGQTGATGLRFKEGTHINKSLSTLALVIKQLSEGQNKHVSYRDSKLTRLLQNSLGGNAKTSIICAVTPAVVEETISTLQFAYRAKAIRNRPEVNAVATSASMIQNLTKKLCTLKAALENKKNVEQDNCKLQNKIANLQKLILNSFHQRSSSDLISGARRKLYQPRRMTISTLHPIQEDPMPDTVPKFCTPSLKYNALLIPGASDFAPIRGSESLSSLPEEPTRAGTPPSNDKKVIFNDEIIEIESDDDAPPDVQTCSPYHSCYDSSKTPPCILRRNYKEAEKNYKDIIKFTEREKLYPPDAVECLKKLEEKSLVLNKLEQDFQSLNKTCNEKDKQIKQLQDIINLSENKLENITAAKTNSDALCKEYQIKLTDWEVSYETLLKKTKVREKELLSLLEEQSFPKCLKENSTMYSPPKSQEQSDQPIGCIDATSTKSTSSDSDFINKHIRDMASEIEEQVALKDQTIIELQATITAHKHNIETLENVNRELKEMLVDYRQNFLLVENENAIYKSKINDLNSLVESLKSEMISLNADIDSYNAVIQDLQEKIVLKDKFSINTMIVDDKDIESMIETEELFIANNENIRNIIQSLKIILESKNEELKNIKTSLNNEEMSYNNSETINLHDEIKKLQDQLDEKMTIIQNLIDEKDNLTVIAQDYAAKNADFEVAKANLESINSKYVTEIQQLKDENNKLNSKVVSIKEELTVQEEIFNSKIAQMSIEIKRLEDIKLKNKNLESNNSDIDLNSAKLALNKLREVIILLSGNIQTIPDIFDDFASIFEVFGENLNALQSVVKSSVEDKKCLQSLINKYEIEIMKLQEILDNASEITSVALKDFVGATKLNSGDGTLTESESKCTLLIKIKTLISNTKNIQFNLNETIQSKDGEIDKLKIDIKERELALNNKSKELTSKTQELHAILEQNDSFLHNILEKVMAVSSELNIEKISFENADNKKFLEYVLGLINNLVNKVQTILTNHDSHESNTLKALADTKAEIKKLNEENQQLSKDISEVEKEKCVLAEDIEAIKSNKEKLISDLMASNRILSELQNDFEAKSSEIEMLKNKAQNWKDKFINVDTTMKLQRHELELENTQLREELERLSSRESITVEKSYNSYSFERIQGNSEQIVDLQSPQSLLTICCEKILDAIQPSDNEQSACSTNSNISLYDSKSQPSCNCLQLKSKIEVVQAENDNLRKNLDHLQIYNENLVKEHEDAERELRLLLNSTYELQKKIVNHRTNLSTLTATTYAENKSLSSQLKSLQHYHSLFYKACEKDIPEVKKELQALMALLQSEHSFKHNESFRRFSLPVTLENSTMQTSKCESLLDGDLLMLDTNISVTTCDNTLTGHEHSGYDVNLSSVEVGYQTNNCSEITEIQNPTLEPSTVRKILESIESLKLENHKLRETVEEYEIIKQNKLNRVDSQNSPIKLAIDVNKTCEKCVDLQKSLKSRESVLNENDTLRQQLSTITSLNCDLEARYKILEVEIDSMVALQIKVKNLEKDLSSKSIEISKLTSVLSEKNQKIENIQEENDTLSNQIMDNIHEADTLKKEIDLLKQKNVETSHKYSKLEEAYDILKVENLNYISNQCRKCLEKDDVIKSLQNTPVSESVSRYNKICTLQSEIHAGREDCNELKNEVTNIKNHLDKNNMSIIQSMDLDESMGDSNSITFKKCVGDDVDNQDVPEERPSDIYTLDKVDCINYCIEKIGTNKATFTCDMKIIDVMKILYTDFYTKHNNEIENLVNKLKDFEESKHLLQKELDNLINSQEKMAMEVEEKNVYLQAMANLVAQIKTTLNFLNNTMNDSELSEVLEFFKNNFFATIDKEFGSISLNIFNNVVNLIDENHRLQIIKLSEENNSQQKLVDKVRELNSELDTLKSELLNKEKEYNLLQMQKARMFEINNAVTLNIVNKEKILYEITEKYYHDLVNKNLINKEIVDMSSPIEKIIPILYKNVFEQSQSINEKNSKLTSEMYDMKNLLDDKNKQLHELQEEFSKLKEINKQTNEELNDKENQLQNQISIHNLLKCTYDKKVEENNTNLVIIENLNEEVNITRNTIECKETTIKALESQLHSQKQTSQVTAEFSKELQQYKDEIDKLKSINNILTQEKESGCVELQRANDIIGQNKIDLEKITSDLLILRETVDQSSNDMETLRMESKTLFEQNTQLKEELKEKTKELSRLETNIKTYQKSAEIQCKMISRLKKEKTDMEKCNSDYIEKVKELTVLLDELKTKENLHVDEINSLKHIKESLENRISGLEKEVHSKQRMSIEMNDSKSKRQNLYDSLRTFSDNDDVADPKKIEAIFKSRKCDDLFMDIDDGSNRSTPIRLNKLRDSLSSKHDQSEEGSRASSVQASRRRRQSIHDAHRSVSALETSQRKSIDRNSESSGCEADSEVSKLRKQLSICREELEEWKEKFQEVDEECEICATYLREREEQCRQLKAEKKVLEVMIEELKQKLQGVNHTKHISVDVAVNTEEDWANLHSVVVDRMSYDAEVDKNKKLSRTIDELRYQKQELKNTLAKMQKSLEKNPLKERELEVIKSELNACQNELVELRKRNRELDEECEICSEYLKERDEQIKKLKEAKKGLEIKLLDYQDSSVLMSGRMKRQTLHDLNRHSNGELVDAATETCADLNNQSEIDENCKVAKLEAMEFKRLTTMIEKLSQQKANLEQQLALVSAATPLYVSTGSAIVQQQQFSDVIKENQKLKNVNAKLTKFYRKIKSQNTNRENEDPVDDINM